jgi:predicted transcriptional regulator
MTKIIIEKNELEAMKNKIDFLLKKAEDTSFPTPTLEPIHEIYELNEKEKLVIEYLNKNPGSTKEQVVSGCETTYSRIPILNAINELLDKGLIINRENNSKKGTYVLFVNYQDILVSLKEDLTLFKHFYSELLDHARPIIMRLLADYKNKKSEFDNLIEAIIGPYKYLCMMYITYCLKL